MLHLLKRPVIRLSTLALFSILCVQVNAQRMTAIHGSPYSGGLSKDHNPAGILNSPDRWDLTLFGLQYRGITNGIEFDNISLLKIPDSVDYHTKSGYGRRYIHAMNSINLLHFRYRLDLRSAFSFGVNLRSYLHGQTSSLFFADTLNDLTEILDANIGTDKYSFNGQTSNWMEYSFAYSRVLKSNDAGRLQAGIDLKVSKALAGAYTRLENLRVERLVLGNTTYYIPSEGKGEYGYSTNMDYLNSKNNVAKPFSSFMKNASMNIGLNLGVEYVRYKDDMYGDARTPVDYDWKLGVSLMDLGRNKYTYSSNSYGFSGTNRNFTTESIDRTFDEDFNLDELQDSMSVWAQDIDTLDGNFKINNPTRLVVNFDKSFPNNFSVNAEAQLNFSSTRSMERINTREMSGITVTPRWEKKALGVYMPFQYNTEGNFWIGMGVKAGPLLLGVDNLGWLISKKSMPNGGLYLALQIRPGKGRDLDAMPCPE